MFRALSLSLSLSLSQSLSLSNEKKMSLGEDLKIKNIPDWFSCNYFTSLLLVSNFSTYKGELSVREESKVF